MLERSSKSGHLAFFLILRIKSFSLLPLSMMFAVVPKINLNEIFKSSGIWKCVLREQLLPKQIQYIPFLCWAWGWPENWCQNQMFDSGKRAFHTFIRNTSWQIQANGTGHICVSMVDSAETTLVIYRKHCKNWMYL